MKGCPKDSRLKTSQLSFVSVKKINEDVIFFLYLTFLATVESLDKNTLSTIYFFRFVLENELSRIRRPIIILYYILIFHQPINFVVLKLSLFYTNDIKDVLDENISRI